jgi:ABC-type Fe3+-hydroxamate transport system substrate-binding protein
VPPPRTGSSRDGPCARRAWTPAQDVEVPADQGFVTFSAERLLDHDADTLITVAGAVYDTEETITASPLYPRLHAVEDDHDYQVSGDMWLGAAPFAAAWIVDDLTRILIDERQPPTAAATERWTTLVSTGHRPP